MNIQRIILPFQILRSAFRLFLFSSTMLCYFSTSFPLAFWVDRSPYKIRRILSRIVGFYSGIVCWIFNIKIKLSGKSDLLYSDKNYFIVANHLSYLDIFIFSSVVPASYVTSIEMKNTPLLGHAAQAAACLYTERRSKENLEKEIGQVSDGLKNGLNVFVFPEATSTNGEKVIMFRKAMFNAPLAAKKEVLPLTINYRKLNGKEINLQNRDLAFWYGDMTFAPHFFKFLLQKSLEIEILVHSPHSTESYSDPAQLANNLHDIIASDYKNII